MPGVAVGGSSRSRAWRNLDQLFGQPRHDQSRIVCYRQQHLAQRLGLLGIEPMRCRPVGRQAQLAEAAERRGEVQGGGSQARVIRGRLAAQSMQTRPMQRGRHGEIEVLRQCGHQFGRFDARAKR
jgi:hypothetical protein